MSKHFLVLYYYMVYVNMTEHFHNQRHLFKQYDVNQTVSSNVVMCFYHSMMSLDVSDM